MEEAQEQHQYKPRRPRSHEDRYLNDPRWETAKRLASECRFAECNVLVLRIMRSYGKIYS